MPKKRPVGRPKVSPADYNKNWQQDMLDHYRDGNSDVSVRVNCFGDRVVSHELWYRWIEEDKKFSQSVKEGSALSMDWWENVSKQHASGEKPQANATSLIFNMCNRFKDHYQQRQVVEQTTAHTLSISELNKLKEELEELGLDTSKL